MKQATLVKLKAISYSVIPPIFVLSGLNKDIVYILGVFIMIDIFTAVLREVVVKGGRFRSRTLWVGLASKGLLILIPLMLVFVGKGIGLDLKWLAELSLSVLILAEFYSTLGNIVQIRKNDKSIDEQDAVTMLIKGIEHIIKDIITTLLSRLKNEKSNE